MSTSSNAPLADRLSLPLFVTRIGTDYPYDTLAPQDLTRFADPPDRTSDFHCATSNFAKKT